MDKGFKYKAKKNVFSINGTLYKDEVVFAEKNVIKESNKKIRVKDQVGKIWFVMPNDIVKVE
jgi:hypothetical protein